MNRKYTLRNIALLAGAALLSTGAMAAAPLNADAVTKTETVHYSIPDAHSASGAAKLYHELNAAAERVCRNEEADAPFNYALSSYEDCVTKALDKAVRKVNIGAVTALYRENAANGRLASNQLPAAEPEVVASR